jgi:hypothetical protein
MNRWTARSKHVLRGRSDRSSCIFKELYCVLSLFVMFVLNITGDFCRALCVYALLILLSRDMD